MHHALIPRPYDIMSLAVIVIVYSTSAQAQYELYCQIQMLSPTHILIQKHTY